MIERKDEYIAPTELFGKRSNFLLLIYRSYGALEMSLFFSTNISFLRNELQYLPISTHPDSYNSYGDSYGTKKYFSRIAPKNKN